MSSACGAWTTSPGDGAGRPLNILSIQSFVAYGHVGNRAAVPVLEGLGHEVWAVNTVTFSNHPGHGAWRGRVVPAVEIGELLAGIAERGLFAACDAVLSGYLGEAGTAPLVLETVARIKAANPRALYCCDPVMGEVGKGFYVRAGLPELFRDRLVPAADLITPNPLELEWLTGMPVTTLDGALAAAQAARRLGPALVVATGLRLDDRPDMVAVLARDAAGAWIVRTPHRNLPAYGAGDAFAALFLGLFLRARDVADALGRAAASLDRILAETQGAGSLELCLVAAREAVVRPGPVPQVERLR